MADEVEKSESGIWFDTQSSQVVQAAPVEGVQLVPPGGELTPTVKANIDRHAEGVVDVIVVDEPDPEPERAPAKKAAAKKGA